MKLLAILLVSSVLSFFSVSAYGQTSADEIDGMMQGITERMRDIEQLLARASQPPENANDLLEELVRAQQSGDYSSMSDELSEMLLSSPDLLAQLTNPDADEAELRLIEDDIRRMFATEENGLQNLLERNPEIVERMLDDTDNLTELVEGFASEEDDLQGLFRDTEATMQSAEEQLVRLIEMAEEAQQRQQEQQSSNSQQEGDQSSIDGRPNSPQPGNPNPPEEEPGVTPTDPPEGGHVNRADGDAWTANLPERARNAARDAQSPTRPDGYETELSEFYRLLSRLLSQSRDND